jgi:NADP-dependent 3-hydroxy acid dehydrogenase YdfG
MSARWTSFRVSPARGWRVVAGALRALSEGLRQEVKPSNIRTTVISPCAVATELPDGVTEPDVAARIRKFYQEIAIPAESFARAVAFDISQPEEVDVNEILFRPTRQEG